MTNQINLGLHTFVVSFVAFQNNYVFIFYIMDSVSSHQFHMYFHSTIRNIGVYTTLAYGSLAYSRAYRGQNSIYDVVLIFISIAFISIAFFINYMLHQDIQSFILKNKDTEAQQLLHISQAIFGIHTILMLLGFFTFLRSINMV